MYKVIKTKKHKEPPHMKTQSSEAAFEQAFNAINLATWNRPRTSNELQDFLARREAIVDSVEL